MEKTVEIFKALGDASRLKALYALRQGWLCACQITALLELAPSTVSRHMMLLQHAGLVKSTKKERWVYYELSGEEAGSRVRQVLDLLDILFDKMDGVEETQQRLEEIKSISPEELCREKSQK